MNDKTTCAGFACLLPLAAILMIAIALSGCSTFGTASGVAIDKARDFNDTKIKAALFILCEESAIGAVRRNFGNNPSAYNAMCSEKPVDKLIK